MTCIAGRTKLPPMARRSIPGKQAGFGYISVLIGLAVMAAGLGAVADVWHTTMQREHEKELLYIGNEFRDALSRHLTARGRYPLRLEELLTDGQTPPKRFIRKIYADPMTGSADWGLVPGPNGQITGVFSKGAGEPLKKTGFKTRDKDFEGKLKYSEWVFTPLSAKLGSLPANTTPNRNPLLPPQQRPRP